MVPGSRGRDFCTFKRYCTNANLYLQLHSPDAKVRAAAETQTTLRLPPMIKLKQIVMGREINIHTSFMDAMYECTVTFLNILVEATFFYGFARDRNKVTNDDFIHEVARWKLVESFNPDSKLHRSTRLKILFENLNVEFDKEAIDL